MFAKWNMLCEVLLIESDYFEIISYILSEYKLCIVTGYISYDWPIIIEFWTVICITRVLKVDRTLMRTVCVESDDVIVTDVSVYMDIPVNVFEDDF